MLTKDLIIERCDPDELIDLLKLDIELLVRLLEDTVAEGIEEGVFDYLTEDEEDEYEIQDEL